MTDEKENTNEKTGRVKIENLQQPEKELSKEEQQQVKGGVINDGTSTDAINPFKSPGSGSTDGWNAINPFK